MVFFFFNTVVIDKDFMTGQKACHYIYSYQQVTFSENWRNTHIILCHGFQRLLVIG